MKKIFFTALTLTAINLNAQVSLNVANRINTELLSNKDSSSRYEKVSGSPYLYESFRLAKISSIPGDVLVRYNAELDEIEIDNGDGKKYLLPKSEDYNTIELKNGQGKFILEKYNDASGSNSYGYLIEKLSKNEIKFYKREKIKLIAAKTAESSYTQDTPAKLIKGNEEYYLKIKDKNAELFPNSKKKLIALFPEKKSEIENFLKDKNPSFKKEEGMSQITEFISTL